jgi:hypothetical protein
VGPALGRGRHRLRPRELARAARPRPGRRLGARLRGRRRAARQPAGGDREARGGPRRVPGEGGLGAAARDADLVYREQPFTCRLDGALATGRFDLAYRRAGRWTLVDFKTARLASAAEARARYGPQLDRYRRALAQLTGDPVDSALCLVRDGQLVAFMG